MSIIYAGDTIYEIVQTGQVGDTITAVYALKPNGSTFSFSQTSLGSGDYQIAIPTAVGEEGRWLFRPQSTLNPGDYQAAVYDVDPATTVSSPTTVWISSGTTTLKDLRRRIMTLSGDGFTATATSASADGQTFKDANSLYLDTNGYRGRFAWAVTGPNAGTQRFIASSSYSARTLTFDPAFASAFAVGNEIDITNERGVGWRPDQIHAAINAGIADAAAMGGVPISAILSGTFDLAVGQMNLPDEFETVSEVAYEDVDGFWRMVPATNDDRRQGWYVGRDGDVLQLLGGIAALADDARVRVWGTGRPAPLTSDTQTTAVNAEWLESFAYARLLASGVRQEPGRGPLLNLWESKARTLKVQAVPIAPIDSVWVRT